MFEYPYLTASIVMIVLSAIWGAYHLIKWAYRRIRQPSLTKETEAREWNLGFGFKSFMYRDAAPLLGERHMAKLRAHDLAMMVQILKAAKGRNGTYLARIKGKYLKEITTYDLFEAQLHESVHPGQYYRLRLREKYAEMDPIGDILARHGAP